MERVLELLLGPFLKVFESKANRVMGAVVLVAILASVISDSPDRDPDAMLTAILTAIGCGGASLLLGIGLLRVLPDAAPPHMRQGGTYWLQSGR
jgi:hypothetical protein